VCITNFGSGALVVQRRTLGMGERRGDLGARQVRAVVAFDQERGAAVVVDMPRPAHCLVERGAFLEQHAVLLQRGDFFRAARTAVNAVSHELPPFIALMRECPEVTSRERKRSTCGTTPPAPTAAFPWRRAAAAPPSARRRRARSAKTPAPRQTPTGTR